MKLRLKLKAFAASLVLAAASGQAGATIQTGTSGELFLTVVSSDNLVSFTKDLGITADSFLSGFAGGSFNLSADAAWNQFLQLVTNPAAMLFSVAALNPNGTASTAGSISAITTVAPGTSAATMIQGTTNTQLTTGIQAAASGYITAVNALQSGVADGSSFSQAGTNAFALNSNNAFNTFLNGQASFNQFGTVGNALSVFLVANGSGGAGGSITADQLLQGNGLAAASFSLTTNGQLSATSTAPVPEPGSWAMLLAGLLAVVAIARRRVSA